VNQTKRIAEWKDCDTIPEEVSFSLLYVECYRHVMTGKKYEMSSVAEIKRLANEKSEVEAQLKELYDEYEAIKHTIPKLKLRGH